MSDTKVCSKCKEEKARSEFSKNRGKKDGLQSECKACHRQNSKQYRQKNLKKLSDYHKQYYQENREKRLDYHKQYHKQWYQENREQKLERQKQWQQENPEKAAARWAKYRALKQDGIPDILRDCPIEKIRLEQIYKLRDLLTKATGVEYHVDHIWPLSKGGPHWSGNLQIITAEENRSKHASFCEDTARIIQESLNENTCGRHRNGWPSLRLHKTARNELYRRRRDLPQHR